MFIAVFFSALFGSAWEFAVASDPVEASCPVVELNSAVGPAAFADWVQPDRDIALKSHCQNNFRNPSMNMFSLALPVGY